MSTFKELYNNGRKVPISVTIPTTCALPLSDNLVTVDGLISTQILLTLEGSKLPVAIE